MYATFVIVPCAQLYAPSGGYSLYHVKLDSGKTVMANVSSLAISELETPALGDEIYVRWSASAGVVLTS